MDVSLGWKHIRNVPDRTTFDKLNDNMREDLTTRVGGGLVNKHVFVTLTAMMLHEMEKSNIFPLHTQLKAQSYKGCKWWFYFVYFSNTFSIGIRVDSPNNLPEGKKQIVHIGDWVIVGKPAREAHLAGWEIGIRIGLIRQILEVKATLEKSAPMQVCHISFLLLFSVF